MQNVFIPPVLTDAQKLGYEMFGRATVSYRYDRHCSIHDAGRYPSHTREISKKTGTWETDAELYELAAHGVVPIRHKDAIPVNDKSRGYGHDFGYLEQVEQERQKRAENNPKPPSKEDGDAQFAKTNYYFMIDGHYYPLIQRHPMSGGNASVLTASGPRYITCAAVVWYFDVHRNEELEKYYALVNEGHSFAQILKIMKIDTVTKYKESWSSKSMYINVDYVASFKLRMSGRYTDE